ncbi:MAG: chemotaxis protein CheX [Elusimicrobia bacterium]|nr:chemotaxis protein CheX [Elusimicrobiota bacterium]
MLIACIHITGAWEGSVVLECPLVLAQQMAARLFDTEPQSVPSVNVQDLLQELVNMIGGQVKTLLPGPSWLSLPLTVDRVMDTLTSHTVMNQMGYDCCGEPLQVTFFKKNGAVPAVKTNHKRSVDSWPKS